LKIFMLRASRFSACSTLPLKALRPHWNICGPDENSPRRECSTKLRLLIDGHHTVITVWFQAWSGLKNGALLIAAEEGGFDLLITADQQIRHQQNLKGRKMALLVLSRNNWGRIISAIAY